MAEYQSVQKGSLKLKGVAEPMISKKKSKKKKEKELKRKMDQIGLTGDAAVSVDPSQRPTVGVDKRTKAELAFEKVKEKRAMEQILKKASKTHKERIMEFNEHLDNLTEHYDIPKVSWTK